MKKCNACKKEKGLNEFPVNIAMTDNRGRTCIDCRKKRTKELYDKKKAERDLYNIF